MPRSSSGWLARPWYESLATMSVVAIAGVVGVGVGTGALLPVIAVIGAAVGAAVLISPLLGLCLIAFMVPLEEGVILAPHFTAVKLAAVLVLLSWLVQWAVSGKRVVIPGELKIATALFGFWGLASVLWAPSKSAALVQWTTLMFLIGLAFLVVQIVDSERKLQVLIASNLVGAFIAAGFGLRAYGAMSKIDPTARAEAFGGQNAGNFPILLCLGASYCLVKAGFSRGLERLLWAGGFSLLVAAALLSGTRTFPIALGAAIVVLGLFIWHGEGRRATWFLAVLVVVVSMGSLAVMPGYLSERVSETPSGLQAISESPRGDIWKVFVVMIRDNPLIGVGLGNTPNAFPRYADITGDEGAIFATSAPISFVGAVGRDPHNDLLTVAAELGFGGLLLYLFLLAKLAQGLRKSLRSVQHGSTLWQLGVVIAMYLTVVLVNGLSNTSIDKKMLWLGFALALAYPRVVQHQAARTRLEASPERRVNAGTGAGLMSP